MKEKKKAAKKEKIRYYWEDELDDEVGSSPLSGSCVISLKKGEEKNVKTST